MRHVVDLLDLEQVAVVGHDSGGLIAHHTLAGDPRVVGMGLIDTEQPQGLSWRFRRLLAGRHAPGFGAALGRLAGARRLRRTGPTFGDAFADPSMLDGDFDELFLRPLADDPHRLAAAVRVLQSFDVGAVLELGHVHRRITVPVRLVWGEQDKFFPVQWAREMVDTFPHATLTVVPGAGLFCHEERPAEVARALVEVVDAATGVRSRRARARRPVALRSVIGRPARRCGDRGRRGGCGLAAPRTHVRFDAVGAARLAPR